MTTNSGSNNLEVMNFAIKYLAHVGNLVRANLPASGEILEVGSGDGTQTTYVGIGRERLFCVENDSRMQSELRTKGFVVAPEVSWFNERRFSGAYSINCLEHIQDDLGHLRSIRRVMLPNGPIVIYVPALPILYTSMDARVGHFRRYTKKSLCKLVKDAGFETVSVDYVDSLGVLVTLAYKLLRLKSGAPSRRSVKLYDRALFPLSRLLDLVAKKVIGKNLIVVAIKP